MFDQYRVDQECSDDVLSLLRKTAGTDPEARVTAYLRMVEILRYEMRREEERGGQLAEEAVLCLGCGGTTDTAGLLCAPCTAEKPAGGAHYDQVEGP